MEWRMEIIVSFIRDLILRISVQFGIQQMSLITLFYMKKKVQVTQRKIPPKI